MEPPTKRPAWELLEFFGNKTFQTEDLVSALRDHPPFILAAKPNAKRFELALQAEKYLASGYQAAGFPLVSVRSEFLPEGHIRFAIDEGPRCYCGSIRIEGAKSLDPTQLIRLLSTSQPNSEDSDDKNSPLWSPGQPVTWGRDNLIDSALNKALSKLGYSNAQAKSELVMRPLQDSPQDSSKQQKSDQQDSQQQVHSETPNSDLIADLLINIASEGEHDRANTIQVFGNQTNIREVIDSFLSLKEEMLIDEVVLNDIRSKLRESGRFSDFKVQFEPKKSTLNLTLHETKGVPPLLEPIDEIGQAFMAAETWIAMAPSRGIDLVVIMEMLDFQVKVIQSKDGLVAQWSSPGIGGEPPYEISFLLDQDGVLLTHSNQSEFLLANTREVAVRFSTNVGLSAELTGEHLFRFAFGGSIHSLSKSERMPNEGSKQSLLTTKIKTTPAGWLPFAFTDKFKTEIRGNELVALREDDLLRIDIRTGEVLEWQTPIGELRFQPQAFAESRAMILRDTATKSNIYEAQKPVSSILKFVAAKQVWQDLNSAYHDLYSELVEDRQRLNPELPKAIRKLVDNHAASGLDAFIVALGSLVEHPRFTIPNDSATFEQWIGSGILRFAARYFPQDSWPCIVARETSRSLMHRQLDAETSKSLEALYTDSQNGPVLFALVANELRLVRHPLASTFAARGLEVLDVDRFSRDYELLTQSIDRRYFSDPLKAIHFLSQGELEAIKELTSDEAIKELLDRAHAQPIDSLDGETLLAFRVLKDAIESFLRCAL